MRQPNGLEAHALRVLLLLAAFDELESVTKLARLDFLVLYPALMLQVAKQIGVEVDEDSMPTESEILAVESQMVRYKYGPWDDRYQPILGMLVGIGLLRTNENSGAVSFAITEPGKKLAKSTATSGLWRQTAARCKFLAQNLDQSGPDLTALIRENLPQKLNGPWRFTI